MSLEKYNFDLVIDKSKKRKHTYIKIKEDKTVVVNTNKYVNDKQLEQILDKKIKWIEKNLDNLTELEIIKPTGTKKHLDKIYFLGELVTIIVVTNEDFDNVVYESETKKLLVNKSRKKTENQVEAWLRSEADFYLTEKFKEKLNEFNTILQSNYQPAFKIKKLKRTWGYCRNRKNITLSYRLIHLKPELIDYVIYHELAHIRQMNHGKKFYNLLEKICPNRKELEADLKQYGIVLNM